MGALGNPAAALTNYQRALGLKPDSLTAMKGLAWILATAPQPTYGTGPRLCCLPNAHARWAEARTRVAGLFWMQLTPKQDGSMRLNAQRKKRGALRWPRARRIIAAAAAARFSLYENRQPFRE